MFSCRVCANTPFAAIFGTGEDSGSIASTSSDSSLSSLDAENSVGDGRLESDSAQRLSAAKGPWSARDEREVRLKKSFWKPYLHPRTRDLWGDQLDAQVEQILGNIARHVSKSQDPIMGESDACIQWHGDFSATGRTAVMMMLKGDKEAETHVLRVMAFMFVDDESFDAIFTSAMDPTAPLETVCNNAECVNLKHVLLPG